MTLVTKNRTTVEDIARIAARVDYLAEHIGYAWESYSETVAQHRSETALYGDSWPGAQLEIASIKRTLEADEAEYTQLNAEYPVYGPGYDELWAVRHAARVAAEADEPF